ncbi:MAG: endonuclease/exonuclease/phosphatase family protein [Polaromonas sp.]|uniref:endonuclease/exonuclease/phosphatase family protein n=1 Tax=Polaromonas sp. TaxID=1869339 RepID=UPI002734454A|nr:endonuclease/exonuclease/phosphatase family protein [Polaromonas sp.]MDP2820232.1 endonuclease/exonuclease/phosphatase family protein [Polaromonas sp.]
MKLATYNVNGIKTRLPQLLEWLDKDAPDVVCLQELKALDGVFPQAALQEAGVDSWVRGQEHASDHAPVWVELGHAKAAAKLRGKAVAKKAKP